MQPTTRYAKSGDVHVAYQVFGEGPDLVLSPGFVSHIENYWDEPVVDTLGNGLCDQRVALFARAQ